MEGACLGCAAYWGIRDQGLVSAGGVRAGGPDLEESFLVFRAEVFPAAHDPRGDPARAGDVGVYGFGGAVAEGGEVFADGLDAATVAVCADLGAGVRGEPGGESV